LVLLTDSSSGCSARVLAADSVLDEKRGIDDKDDGTRPARRLSSALVLQYGQAVVDVGHVHQPVRRNVDIV
jgi:hypothetical protein